MAFEQFPYTDLHNLNLDWMLSKLKEFNTRMDTIRSEILEAANANTEEKINALTSRYEADIFSLRRDYAAFQQTVTNSLTTFGREIDTLESEISANAAAQKLYTDTAISINNRILLEELTENVSEFLVVINPFTGSLVSIQEMVDYLSQFHMDNAIDYDTLAEREKTFDQLAGLNITYTQMAINGNILIT